MRKLLVVLIACLGLFATHPLLAKTKNTLSFKVKGIADPARSNAQGQLTFSVQNLGDKPSREQLQQFYRESEALVKKSLQPFGYFHATVTLKKRQHGNKVALLYQVNPGKQVRVTRLTVRLTGPGAKAIEKTRAQLSLAIGKPLNIPDYTHSKQRLLDAAHAIGFLAAKLTVHEVKIDLQHFSASIHLVLNTGPQYYFGPVQFSKTPMDPNFLRRYIQFKPGEPYSQAKIDEFQHGLTSSGYFRRVMIKPRMKKVKQLHVPLKVKLKMRKSQAYTIGVGYGTDTSFRGTLGWEWRRITPTGHRMTALAQGGLEHHQAFQARYVIPGRNPLTDEYHFAATVFHLDTDSSNSKGVLLSAAYLTICKSWRQTIALKFLSEHATDQVGVPDRTISLLYPNVVWHKVKAENNNTITVSKGYSINFNLQGALDDVASQVTFGQALFTVKGIYSFSKATRVVGRVSAGLTGIKNINLLPPSLQFKTGGAQSIRGYEFDSIGPDKNLLIASTEVQHRVYKNWGIGVFADMGDTFDDKLSPKYGAGGSLIYFSPIGPIEIGFVHPFNRNKKSFAITFTMGPDLQ